MESLLYTILDQFETYGIVIMPILVALGKLCADFIKFRKLSKKWE